MDLVVVFIVLCIIAWLGKRLADSYAAGQRRAGLVRY
jgi:hypothetical protein